MLQTTFISYGGPDEAFAEKLHRALERRGVKTWFFPKHSVGGQKLHDAMRSEINAHDRVLLICSRHSLDRRGVLNELEQVLAREAREGGTTILIPITIDGYLFNEWQPADPGKKQEILDRVVADFRGTENSDTQFTKAVDRVVRALTRKKSRR